MFISFYKKGEKESMSFCSISKVTFKPESFRVYLMGPNVPTIEDIEGIYPYNSYQDSLKKIMRQIFEAQLLHD